MNYIDKDAVIVGGYRYFLTRVWEECAPSAVFIGLNPSTADAENDDSTIRQCVKHAKSWGCGALVMLNLFAWRDTHPENLFKQDNNGIDIVGPDNDSHIIDYATGAKGPSTSSGIKHVVAAWGTWSKYGAFLKREADVLNRLQAKNLSLKCLKKNKDGTPGHPLYIAVGTALLPFP